MLEPGQKIYWIGKKSGKEKCGTVLKVHDEKFILSFNGKRYICAASTVGDLFYTQHRIDEEKLQNERIEAGKIPPKEKNCMNCFHHKNGRCTSLQGIICDDYQECGKLREKDKEFWPEMGDASFIREKGYRKNK